MEKSKVVVVSSNGKKEVAYLNSKGQVQGLSDMNYKHFQNAYNKWQDTVNDSNIVYEDFRGFSDKDLVENIMNGEAAKRVLLERDYLDNKELDTLKSKLKSLQDELDVTTKRINEFTA